MSENHELRAKVDANRELLAKAVNLLVKLPDCLSLFIHLTECKKCQERFVKLYDCFQEADC